MRDSKTPITVKAAFQSLQAAGYPRSFVTRFLPEWWDNSLLKTSAGALQFALILQQRLGLDVKFGQDGVLCIQPQSNKTHTNFKRRIDTNVNELNVAANLGVAAARIAVITSQVPYKPLSCNPKLLYENILQLSGKNCVDYEGLLDFCWLSGIPVLFLKEMPRNTKRMTGMAVMVDGRPVILLGFNYSQYAKQLFVLAHELAHIVCGHLENNGALIDEEVSGISEGLEGSATIRKDRQEIEADLFALNILRNGNIDVTDLIPRQTSSAVLAATAIGIGAQMGIDAGHLIVSYAKEHDDWIRASQALNFIEQRVSAVEVLKERFYLNSDLSRLGDESKEYILSVQGY
ncbi:ImmA/IrrE family metallo-endopeptidase [Nitrincola alkalilacustris]|uniref:ImmA/IrrE family metallo-endopeptidase n=1 Tax=Nitrincola alkalilacustris TaxID=1571224 RepID=UPI00145676AB|nr:ImmA/IrrE family metallo-endopeptidase [Nitrincola alkalilacustris]